MKFIEKKIAVITLILFILSLIPVMYLGRFNHPTGDDYYYGVTTKHTLEETGNFFYVLETAAKGVIEQYNIWQGTYSAMFLMYLPPNIFGDWAYHLVTTVLLLLLSGGVFFVTRPFVVSFLKGTKSVWIFLSSILCLLMIQTVPAQGESFFWYNGSMYYTGFFALTLFFLGFLYRYLIKAKKYHLPLLIFLAAFLAGGNYVSLLPTILLVATVCIWSFYKKNKKGLSVLIIESVLLIGLTISAAAPGNSIRQSQSWGIAPWKAVIKSLLHGFAYTYAWFGLLMIAALVCITPFLWKSFKNTEFQFRYPILAVGFIYGLFCSMSCPTYYAMNSIGPARAVDIVYYGFILAIFFAYVYSLGFLHRILQGKEKHGIIMTGWGLVVVLVLIQMRTWTQITEMTTIKSVQILVSGEAEVYEAEYLERLQILEDDEIKDVVFLPYTVQPDMLYVGDMQEDPTHITNQKVAEYFHKGSIYVQYTQ